MQLIGQRKWVLILATVLAVTFAQCNESSAKSEGVQGTYQVNGTNPDGTPYRGNVTVTQSGEDYLFNWNIAGDQFSGKGNLSGTTLTVDWGQDFPVIYEVKDNGAVLEGTWADGQGSETLTK
ncbi:MAG: fibronectin-binding protein [Leptospiraceae bacterium]